MKNSPRRASCPLEGQNLGESGKQSGFQFLSGLITEIAGLTPPTQTTSGTNTPKSPNKAHHQQQSRLPVSNTRSAWGAPNGGIPAVSTFLKDTSESKTSDKRIASTTTKTGGYQNKTNPRRGTETPGARGKQLTKSRRGASPMETTTNNKRSAESRSPCSAAKTAKRDSVGGATDGIAVSDPPISLPKNLVPTGDGFHRNLSAAEKKADKAAKKLANKTKLPTDATFMVEGIDNNLMASKNPVAVKKLLGIPREEETLKSRVFFPKEKRYALFFSASAETSKFLLEKTWTNGLTVKLSNRAEQKSKFDGLAVVLTGVNPAISDADLEEEIGMPCKRLISAALNRPTWSVRVLAKDSDTKQRLLKKGLLFNGRHLKVVEYKAARAPVQCYGCQQIGHIAADCQQQIKCPKCTGPHKIKDCPLKEQDKPKCANCSGEHVAYSPACPVVQKAKEAKRSQDLKVVEATRKGADLVESSRLATCLTSILVKLLTHLGRELPLPTLAGWVAEAVSTAFRTQVPPTIINDLIKAMADRDPTGNHGRS